ncbi:MAG: hypothetical protein ACOYMA_22155, partial [Bacteroidia bacterium]
MRVIILMGFCIFLNTTVHAQPYFSRMFDFNYYWDGFNNFLFKENSNIILTGTTVNLLVNDSTKYQKILLLKLNSSGEIIGENIVKQYSKNSTTLEPIKSSKNKVVYGFYDSISNFDNYYLSNIDNNLDLLNIVPLKFQKNTSLTNTGTLLSNKLYFFCADYTSFVASKLKLSMQCMDTNGNLLWGKVFQDKRCYTNNVVQTKDGNFLLAGFKYYGESLGAQDSAFAWYAKVDTLGNILWEKDLIRGSPFLCDDLWASNADGDIYLSGSLLAFQGNIPIDLHRDSSYCTIAKIDDKTGNIIWHKQYFTERQKIQGLLSVIKPLNYYNGSLYTLVDHFVSERENPNDLSQYVMFAKFDLQGNLIWKRLFSNWYLS